MALTLGLVFAVILMVELKRIISSSLRDHMSAWKRHVDDTMSYVEDEFNKKRN